MLIVCVAGEELMPRPVERMDVEDRGVLPGSLDVAVEFVERVIELAVGPGVGLPQRGVIIDCR